MSNKRHLGDALESLINLACYQYQVKGVANIQKYPTPYKIIGQDKRRRCLLAVPDEKGGVDYMGEYGGRPIAIEAKKTESRTRYPLDPWDREKHQREFLDRWNGLAFYLISFWSLGEHYLVPWAEYKKWHEQAQQGGRKSVPLSWFRENMPKIKEGGKVALDFLAAVDKLVEKGGVA